jgi:hypothetical protein
MPEVKGLELVEILDNCLEYTYNYYYENFKDQEDTSNMETFILKNRS